MATSISSPAFAGRDLRGLRTWAWATLAFFVLVVLEGAVVRATSSGGGCGNHWPLCNGEVLPHHPRLATIIEFTHRSLTGACTAMFAVLIAWTFRITAKGHPARLAAVAAGALLLLEGALGALLVKGGYVEKNASLARVVVQGVHFTNTLLLLAAATVLAVLLGRQRKLAAPALRLPVWTALIATLVTGATGSIAALADTLFPSGSLSAALAADFAANSPLLIRMRWIHPAASSLVAIACLWIFVQLRKRGNKRVANLVIANLGAQIVIGTANVLLLAPTWIQVLHLLGADIFWITLVALAVPPLTPATAEAVSTR